MPASKLSDLLPIRMSTGKPNAYQVFGLKSGEPDTAKITAAIKRVYQTLKESRSSADPAVWKQAAKLAEAARKQLEDPQQRRALDAGLAAGDDTAGGGATTDNTATSEPDDPLASLLPSAKPKSKPATASPAAVLGMPPGLSAPAQTTSNSAANVSQPATPASVLGTPPLGAPATGTPATDTPAQPAQPTPASVATAGNAPIAWTPPKKQKTKRRRKKTGVFLFALFVIVMLGAIVGLLQFLTQGGQIAVRPPGDDGGGIVIGNADPEPEPPRPAAPASDGVLGDVAASGIAESLRRPNDGIPADDGRVPSDSNSQPDAMPSDQVPGDLTSPSPIPPAGMPDSPSPMPAQPAPAEATDPMTPANIAANQEKIEAVEQLIRAADWDQMKPAAEALLKLKLNAQQSKRASSLYDIADLASFYRGAIGRGLATLNTGGTFDYVEGVPVIVVEVSPEDLTIQFNKRTRSFTVDEMPPRLTEKITSFALSPERPDAIAGQALYRLIHPKWRAEYRDDTFDVLASIDGELEQVDTAILQQVAKELFPK
ncbi:hypothetical protein Mal15_05400 [Stieleria maiorica]|uniref:Uncharacterized protein n=1 Tax=Stieleria maiorica TaxID=2795974 RepID=A0A5B9M625_9BACT|nr:hypothetical protein [Stieleria maiorica]QEF96512.1 hypothetical protein Mal15_05400 [Stieleria maiorica]